MEARYDTFGARFGAGIVDWLIFLPLGILFACVLPFLNDYKLFSFIANSLFDLSFLAYIVLTTGRTGQTFGKQAMGIRIVTFPEEQQISYKQAFIRELPYAIVQALGVFVSFIALFAPGTLPSFLLWTIETLANNGALLWFIIELASMFSNDMRRAAHDLIAKTVVVRINAPSTVRSSANTK